VFDSLAPLASAGLRYAPSLMLLWLAFFFGRTLRAGERPLIERIARAGMAAVSPAICRYTRGLTAVWCAYFVAAAVLTLAANFGFRGASLGVAAASALFFVGEHWLRRLVLFRHETFPGLIRQIRDTASVCRPRAGARADTR
jgi:uncharacterized membrane protein